MKQALDLMRRTVNHFNQNESDILLNQVKKLITNKSREEVKSAKRDYEVSSHTINTMQHGHIDSKKFLSRVMWADKALFDRANAEIQAYRDQ